MTQKLPETAFDKSAETKEKPLKPEDIKAAIIVLICALVPLFIIILYVVFEAHIINTPMYHASPVLGLIGALSLVGAVIFGMRSRCTYAYIGSIIALLYLAMMLVGGIMFFIHVVVLELPT